MATATTTVITPAAAAPTGLPERAPVPASPTDATDPQSPARPVRSAVEVLFWMAWLGAFVVLAVLVWPVTLGGATSLTVVSGTSKEPTYHTGDLAVVRRSGDIAVGDVIVYTVPRGEPGEGRRVIHRVIGGDPVAGFVTRGDNRDTPDMWRPRAADVVGTVRAIVPQGGTWALRAFSPIGLGLVAAVLLVWVLWPSIAGGGDGAHGDDRGEGEDAPADG
jgi:signal peptidase